MQSKRNLLYRFMVIPLVSLGLFFLCQLSPAFPVDMISNALLCFSGNLLEKVFPDGAGAVSPPGMRRDDGINPNDPGKTARKCSPVLQMPADRKQPFSLSRGTSSPQRYSLPKSILRVPVPFLRSSFHETDSFCHVLLQVLPGEV